MSSRIAINYSVRLKKIKIIYPSIFFIYIKILIGTISKPKIILLYIL